MNIPVVVRIDRSWDEPAWQTADFRPALSCAALLSWIMEPPPVDAGVPAPIIKIVSEVAASMGPVAFRLFFPEDMPTGIRRLAPAKPALPVRICQRLTRRWPADLAVALDPAGVAELFSRDWQLQGQTALVLQGDTPTDETLGRLRQTRDWSRGGFPADARLLIAPAVDGDGILFAAASAEVLGTALGILTRAFQHAGETVDWGTAPGSDRPAMEIAINRHVDASEPDEHGFHEYHYEYDILEFSRTGRTYIVRSYADTPDRAAFLSCREGDESHLLGPADLIHPLLVEAVDYLHATGKTTLERLSASDGYVPLEVATIPTPD
ncbi:hypothetical protein [Mesorhizobium sp. CAU 1732]|uniref:hypothetical protein n=1 Tax=Mesorhizobium sp. CAU 1732 TaxID=3140358 RepID=UPI003260459F